MPLFCSQCPALFDTLWAASLNHLKATSPLDSEPFATASSPALAELSQLAILPSSSTAWLLALLRAAGTVQRRHAVAPPPSWTAVVMQAACTSCSPTPLTQPLTMLRAGGQRALVGAEEGREGREALLLGAVRVARKLRWVASPGQALQLGVLLARVVPHLSLVPLAKLCPALPWLWRAMPPAKRTPLQAAVVQRVLQLLSRAGERADGGNRRREAGGERAGRQAKGGDVGWETDGGSDEEGSGGGAQEEGGRMEAWYLANWLRAVTCAGLVPGGATATQLSELVVEALSPPVLRRADAGELLGLMEGLARLRSRWGESSKKVDWFTHDPRPKHQLASSLYFYRVPSGHRPHLHTATSHAHPATPQTVILTPQLSIPDLFLCSFSAFGLPAYVDGCTQPAPICQPKHKLDMTNIFFMRSLVAPPSFVLRLCLTTLLPPNKV